MPLTSEQIVKVKEVLDSKLRHACSSCGLENRWVVMPGISLIPTISHVELNAPAENIIPAILVVCSNCGLTQTYNIHVLGLAQVLGVPDPSRAIPEFKKEVPNG